jgi:CheY-like chemotaxis protein
MTPPTVMVVDDDPDIVATLESIHELEGLRVLTSPDGRRALSLLRAGERPAVILLDLMMPEMSGAEFRAEQLRDRDIASIPVIVFTGDPDAEQKAISLGTVGLPEQARDARYAPLHDPALLQAGARRGARDGRGSTPRRGEAVGATISTRPHASLPCSRRSP